MDTSEPIEDAGPQDAVPQDARPAPSLPSRPRPLPARPARLAPDPDRGRVRGSSRALWLVSATFWLTELWVGIATKPRTSVMDPVSMAGSNHRKNMAWAGKMFWVLGGPALGAAVFAGLGMLVLGRDRKPGRVGLAAAAGAVAGTVAVAGLFVYRFLSDFQPAGF